MIGLNTIMLGIFLTMLFGTIVLSLSVDLINAIVTGSSDSWSKLATDIYSITTAGNSQINRGVTGLVELPGSQLTDTQKETLKTSYKNDILMGSAIMIFLIGFFTFLFQKVAKWIFGADNVGLLTCAVISMVLIAICIFVFTGFHDYPYSGWVRMISNWNVVGPAITSNQGGNVTILHE